MSAIDVIFCGVMSILTLAAVSLVLYGIWRWYLICGNCGCVMFYHGPSETWCAGCPKHCKEFVRKTSR